MNKLQIRLIRFSADILVITENLSKRSIYVRICDQMNRSATAIGANYSEAQSAASTKDYINKVKIALKEARETEYWLMVFKTKNQEIPGINQLIDEVVQIIRILTSICNKARLRSSI